VIIGRGCPQAQASLVRVLDLETGLNRGLSRLHGVGRQVASLARVLLTGLDRMFGEDGRQVVSRARVLTAGEVLHQVGAQVGAVEKVVNPRARSPRARREDHNGV